MEVPLYISCVFTQCLCVSVLDDDSSQLHEIIELFSTMALPLKVDRLIKAGHTLCCIPAPGARGRGWPHPPQVSSSWRDKVETTMAELKTAGEEVAKQEDKEEEESTGEGGEGGEASCEAGEGGEASSEGGETVMKEDKKTACFEVTQQRGEIGRQFCFVFQALYGNGISSLAEMTSTSIELFRKMGEVLLLPDVSSTAHPSTPPPLHPPPLLSFPIQQSQKHDVLEQAQKFNRSDVVCVLL